MPACWTLQFALPEATADDDPRALSADTPRVVNDEESDAPSAVNDDDSRALSEDTARVVNEEESDAPSANTPPAVNDDDSPALSEEINDGDSGDLAEAGRADEGDDSGALEEADRADDEVELGAPEDTGRLDSRCDSARSAYAASTTARSSASCGGMTSW